MKKNILIWGTGLKGDKAYGFLERHREYCVIAFGDNDIKMKGKKKYGKIIYNSLDVCSIPNLAGIVIASSSSKVIRKQLEHLVKDIEIYDNIEELMYTRISIDISGSCNAKCKWCITGRKNRRGGQVVADSYINIDEFIKLYEHIYGIGMIEKSTEIMLYNWGEPFLNKDYIPIIEYLADQNQTFSVSTNASIIRLTGKENTYKHCKAFTFSMPGFSQRSYDRIHGLNFNCIKSNIRSLSENIRKSGFVGDGSISFHVYKFNSFELDAAKQFADEVGLRLNAYYPYFNGNSMAQEYLEGEMDECILYEAEKEMYLGHVDELIKKRPNDYTCFLKNIISIDCNANIVLCCAADPELPDYEWKSVFEITSLENMRKERTEMLKCQSCQSCRTLGIDYWMGNNPSYKIKT